MPRMHRDTPIETIVAHIVKAAMDEFRTQDSGEVKPWVTPGFVRRVGEALHRSADHIVEQFGSEDGKVVDN